MNPTTNEKFLAYLALFSGLSLSIVAEFYSILGLTAIFAAAVIPVIIMGMALGVGKITATLWLKQNWKIAPYSIRAYLGIAIVVLMLITSMGIFGFLSKAHSDQSLVSGNVGAKIAVYDEKIKTEKENIDANRKALKQMDEAVDQVMARSTSEGGADKAVAIRRSQQKERARLLADNSASQKRITTLNEERAPIAAEVRKVEAEVGPIKYIAAFVYGATDESILEKAVTWVIITLIIVFDPLAVILLLASQISFQNFRERKQEDNDPKEFFDKAREIARQLDADAILQKGVSLVDPSASVPLSQYEPDDGALTDEQIELIRTMAKDELPTGEVITKSSLFPDTEEEFPFRGKGLQPSMPLTASYVQPIDEEIVEELAIDEPNPMAMEERPGDYIELAPAVEQIKSEYVMYNGNRYHRRALPANYVEPAEVEGYVQNEEQTESNLWTSTVGHPITQEEYIKTTTAKKS
jgi:hypothetical protein